MLNRHIVYRVAVAVLVIDDFNDKILSGSAVQVRIVGLPDKPIRKSDGYFVFTTGRNEIRQIEVESHFYHKAVINLEPGKLNPQRPVLKVRLQPNRLYAAPGNVTFLEGRAKPDSEIQVIPEIHHQNLKLLYDYQKDGKTEDREISLFQAEKKDLAGKNLAIREKEQKEPEVFQILETTDQEQGTFLLAEALSKGYKKAGTTILPVYTTKADARGEYFLLLPGIEGKEACPCRIRCLADKETTIKATLTPGQGNRQDLE